MFQNFHQTHKSFRSEWVKIIRSASSRGSNSRGQWAVCTTCRPTNAKLIHNDQSTARKHFYCRVNKCNVHESRPATELTSLMLFGRKVNSNDIFAWSSSDNYSVALYRRCNNRNLFYLFIKRAKPITIVNVEHYQSVIKCCGGTISKVVKLLRYRLKE